MMEQAVKTILHYDIPVLVHAMHKANGQCTHENTAQQVAVLARRHPELRILMAHMGGNVYHHFNHNMKTGELLKIKEQRMGEPVFWDSSGLNFPPFPLDIFRNRNSFIIACLARMLRWTAFFPPSFLFCIPLFQKRSKERF